MPTLHAAAPQFLVRDLPRALAFYEHRLGFSIDFVYEGFYAGVSRDAARIHLKCAPSLEAERDHRKKGDHLDAHLDVTDVQVLHDELSERGAPICKPLEERPWAVRDFTVEDPDGYLLCFSEATEGGS